MSIEGIQSLLGRIARNGRGQKYDFVATTGLFRNAAIFAVPASTFRGTIQFSAEAFTILAQAAIVLTGASLSDHFGFDDKGIRALFHGVLDGSQPAATGFRGIAAAYASANVRVTDFAIVKARAVQFQAPRVDAVASNLTGWQFVQWIAHSGGGKRPRVPREYRTNGFGTGPVDATFGNGIFTVQTGAAVWMTTTSGFETIAVQCHALALGTGTARGIVVQFANFQRGRA
jgi:hypothetical protein